MDNSSPFVQISPETQRFSLGGRPYCFLGTNFWYGMPLGATGNTGDRFRLLRELDKLAALGVTNLRVLAASEGPDTEPWRMVAALQYAPGQYREEQFEGLDFLLAEMAKRNMKAVVVLGNMWQWSGGFAAYVAWVSDNLEVPYPGHSNEPEAWNRFQAFASRFFHLPEARRMYRNHLTAVVNRKNTVTGIVYKEDPTIMAWQLANEPRGEINDDAYYQWVKQSASHLKALDSRHLVSIGSEGVTPWGSVLDNRFNQVHQLGDIDYATFHIWVQNWNWYDPKKPDSKIEDSIGQYVTPYLEDHLARAKLLNMPIVLEEFGISRNQGSCDPRAATETRDQYYTHIFGVVAEQVRSQGPLCGVNFWAWSGEAKPESPACDWQPGQPYTGDPPHEPQGWYGVYDDDRSTCAVIESFAKNINRK